MAGHGGGGGGGGNVGPWWTAGNKKKKKFFTETQVFKPMTPTNHLHRFTCQLRNGKHTVTYSHIHTYLDVITSNIYI